ncbi:MAG: acyl carrier protein, partial [Gammaproteobacteria bacterium]|nr:acyl carrier protein [Gammaproteobacteria bacterium]
MSSVLDPSAARDPDERSRALLTVVDSVARELHRGHDGLPAARLDSSLAEELAIDSLARVELGQRLEQVFGCALADQHLFDAETPRDLLAALDAGAGRASLAL